MKFNYFKQLLLSSSIMGLVACGGGSGGSENSHASQQNSISSDETKQSGSLTQTETNSPLLDVADMVDESDVITLPPLEVLDNTVEEVVNCLSGETLKDGLCVQETQQTANSNLIKSLIVNNKYDLVRATNQQGEPVITTLTPSICMVNNGVVETLAVGNCTLNLAAPTLQRSISTESRQITLPVYATHNAPVSDVSNCQAGVLAQTHKDTALNTLNEIRALHGLSPVTYDVHYDDEMMQAALINAANQAVSHQPSNTSKCYSDVGYNGTNTSNIEFNYYDKLTGLNGYDPIVNAITERYSSTLGHRRWFLSPFLKRISFGAVAGASNQWSHQYIVGYATKVVFPEDMSKPTQHKKGVIAYPYQNYPAKYFVRGVPFSVSILEDQNHSGANVGVRFNDATITVTERASGVVQKITNVSFDNLGMGLPNSLQFNFNDVMYGKTYDVQINNVRFNGEIKNYKYWFKIVD